MQSEVLKSFLFCVQVLREPSNKFLISRINCIFYNSVFDSLRLSLFCDFFLRNCLLPSPFTRPLSFFPPCATFFLRLMFFFSSTPAHIRKNEFCCFALFVVVAVFSLSFVTFQPLCKAGVTGIEIWLLCASALTKSN